MIRKQIPSTTGTPNSTKDQTDLLPTVSKAASGFGEVNQSAVVDKFFKGKRDGFFIEAGAWDGEYLSNTLFFERERNWAGLLVEANRLAFRTMVLRETRKGSLAANVCLSVNNYPRKMIFDAADVFGGVVASDHLPEQDILGLSVPTQLIQRRSLTNSFQDYENPSPRDASSTRCSAIRSTVSYWRLGTQPSTISASTSRAPS